MFLPFPRRGGAGSSASTMRAWDPPWCRPWSPRWLKPFSSLAWQGMARHVAQGSGLTFENKDWCRQVPSRVFSSFSSLRSLFGSHFPTISNGPLWKLGDLVMIYHAAALTVFRYMSFSLALFGFRKLPVFRKATVECWVSGDSFGGSWFPGATCGAANRLCRAVHAIQPVAGLMTWGWLVGEWWWPWIRAKKLGSGQILKLQTALFGNLRFMAVSGRLPLGLAMLHAFAPWTWPWVMPTPSEDTIKILYIHFQHLQHRIKPWQLFVHRFSIIWTGVGTFRPFLRSSEIHYESMGWFCF